MKKFNTNGFVLAETLVVTVFLMSIFAMLYSNFYPLIGEYEKRETYDDVDGKYSIYWIKKLIEDSSYNPNTSSIVNFQEKSYLRFSCSDMTEDAKKQTCKRLLNNLEVTGCDKDGDNCEIFITKYRIGTAEGLSFKNTAKQNLKRYEEACQTDNCRTEYINSCIIKNPTMLPSKCEEQADKKVFRSGLKDYILYLPDYSTPSLNYANYRVIASFHHKKDNNNYYSYATMEVNR